MADEPILNAHNKSEYPPAHTAEHILNQTMVRKFGCSRSHINHIERKKSKCSYILPTCPTEEDIRDVENTVNRVIESDLQVTTRYVSRDELPTDIDTSKLDNLSCRAADTAQLAISACAASLARIVRRLGSGGKTVSTAGRFASAPGC